jgi:hypothetical protein
MDTSKLGLVACLVIFIVIGVNGMIYLMVRRDRSAGAIELFRRASHKARNPWQEEEESLKELSKRVSELKQKGQNGS